MQDQFVAELQLQESLSALLLVWLQLCKQQDGKKHRGRQPLPFTLASSAPISHSCPGQRMQRAAEARGGCFPLLSECDVEVESRKMSWEVLVLVQEREGKRLSINLFPRRSQILFIVADDLLSLLPYWAPEIHKRSKHYHLHP